MSYEKNFRFHCMLAFRMSDVILYALWLFWEPFDNMYQQLKNIFMIYDKPFTNIIITGEKQKAFF